MDLDIATGGQRGLNCSNCATSFDASSKKAYKFQLADHTDSNSPAPSLREITCWDAVKDIYNLKQSNSNNNTNNSRLCSTCANLLANLYKLYYDFNRIRNKSSFLQREIQNNQSMQTYNSSNNNNIQTPRFSNDSCHTITRNIHQEQQQLEIVITPRNQANPQKSLKTLNSAYSSPLQDKNLPYSNLRLTKNNDLIIGVKTTQARDNESTASYNPSTVPFLLHQALTSPKDNTKSNSKEHLVLQTDNTHPRLSSHGSTNGIKLGLNCSTPVMVQSQTHNVSELEITRLRADVPLSNIILPTSHNNNHEGWRKRHCIPNNNSINNNSPKHGKFSKIIIENPSNDYKSFTCGECRAVFHNFQHLSSHIQKHMTHYENTKEKSLQAKNFSLEKY